VYVDASLDALWTCILPKYRDVGKKGRSFCVHPDSVAGTLGAPPSLTAKMTTKSPSTVPVGFVSTSEVAAEAVPVLLARKAIVI
jgi:hypothetical protein